MRAHHLQQTRPQWYDRNPLTIGLAYLANGIAPHGQTQRVTYTAPALRKAILEASTGSALRETVAAPAALVRVTLAGTYDAATIAYQPFVQFLSNIVGDQAGYSTSQQALMNPGNNFRGFTEDTSTGGTIAYCVSAKITEYDA